MYRRLVYVSQAAPGLGPRDTYDIIRVAVNRNSQLGLTGALLVLDGHFVQLLEGQPHQVEARFQRIAADARHCALDLRQSLPTSELLFPADWMALRSEQQIAPGVRQAFGYRPGLPATQFDADRVVGFLLACCGRAAPAGAGLPTQAVG